MNQFMRLRSCVGCIACLSILSAHASPTPLTVSAGASRASAAPATLVDATKQEAAVMVARLLRDPAFASSLTEEFERVAPGKEKAASLEKLLTRYEANLRLPARPQASTNRGTSEGHSLRALDRALLAYKGIEKVSAGLLEVRLYAPAGETMIAPQLGQTLVAYEPAGDDKQWDTVEAYDSQGNLFHLDARRAPSYPVLVVDIDGQEDMRAGVEVANRLLQDEGLQQRAHVSPLSLSLARQRGATTERLDTAKLERIRLRDDQEPWISGVAEVYAVVSGVQPGKSTAQLEIVDMPYLFHDNQTYAPNQILIDWANYRFGAANILLYERDDDTNYKELATALANAVAGIAAAAKPEVAIVVTIAQAIMKAMPDAWFKNNDDYIDSFYTLEKNRSYFDYAGAANNAVITLTPFQLSRDTAPEKS